MQRDDLDGIDAVRAEVRRHPTHVLRQFLHTAAAGEVADVIRAELAARREDAYRARARTTRGYVHPTAPAPTPQATPPTPPPTPRALPTPRQTAPVPLWQPGHEPRGVIWPAIAYGALGALCAAVAVAELIDQHRARRRGTVR